jgi:hypothetical protein
LLQQKHNLPDCEKHNVRPANIVPRTAATQLQALSKESRCEVL